MEVDDRILSMLELADQMYQTTTGKLNIAMGSVLNIWHNYREAAEAAETDADNKPVSYTHLPAFPFPAPILPLSAKKFKILLTSVS